MWSPFGGFGDIKNKQKEIIDMVQVYLDHLYKLGASAMAEVCKAKAKRKDAKTRRRKKATGFSASLRLCVLAFRFLCFGRASFSAPTLNIFGRQK